MLIIIIAVIHRVQPVAVPVIVMAYTPLYMNNKYTQRNPILVLNERIAFLKKFQ